MGRRYHSVTPFAAARALVCRVDGWVGWGGGGVGGGGVISVCVTCWYVCVKGMGFVLFFVCVSVCG